MYTMHITADPSRWTVAFTVVKGDGVWSITGEKRALLAANKRALMAAYKARQPLWHALFQAQSERAPAIATVTLDTTDWQAIVTSSESDDTHAQKRAVVAAINDKLRGL